MQCLLLLLFNASCHCTDFSSIPQIKQGMLLEKPQVVSEFAPARHQGIYMTYCDNLMVAKQCCDLMC